MKLAPHVALALATLALTACGEDPAPAFTGDSSVTDLGVDVAVVDTPAPMDASVRDVAPTPDVVVPRDNGAVAPDVPPVSGGVYDYAISTLSLDPGTAASIPHFGFNLDARFSSQVDSERMPADCNHGDFISALDVDQNMGGCMFGTGGCRGGVDNQLPELAEAGMMAGLFDLRTRLASEIDQAHLVFLLRVSNVDGPLSPTLEDPEVTVRVYTGQSMIPYAMCDSLHTPGNAYAIDTSSLLNPSDINSARFAMRGSIHAGRLQIGGPMIGDDLILTLPILTANLELRGAQLRMNLAMDRTTDGNLGGYVRAQDAIDSILKIPAAEPYAAVINGLVRGLVDLQGGGSCGLSTGSIGMGMGFTSVRATIAPTPVSGPQPGMCGS